MSNDQIAYYLARAAEERERAARSRSQKVQGIHLALATCYERKAKGMPVESLVNEMSAG